MLLRRTLLKMPARGFKPVVGDEMSGHISLDKILIRFEGLSVNRTNGWKMTKRPVDPLYRFIPESAATFLKQAFAKGKKKSALAAASADS